MLITLADIEGMASPGWGCGSDPGEALDEGFGEVLGEEDYSDSESDLAAAQNEPEGEIKPVRYADGRREGLSTLEICTRLKNEKMTGENRREQEFLAILQTYPRNGADFKILTWLAHGFSCRQAGERLRRSEKTIRNAARRLRQFRDDGTVKFLPPGLVQAGEDLLKPFPPTKAGRKPKGWTEIKTEITTAVIFDLLGDPIPTHTYKPPRKTGPRRPRRPGTEIPGQLAFEFAFAMAA